MELALIAVYGISMLYIFLFSLVQLQLALSYRKTKKKKPEKIPVLSNENLPTVAIQLPVYNEKYVVERLIDCVAGITYPKEKLEIQVLDDSTDETSRLIAAKLEHHRSLGLNIFHIKRNNRDGFKAGALQYGLEHTDAELIAIFDADFLPPQDFLVKVVPHFQNATLGMAQTRWGHLNSNFSLMTRLQAFGLNGHFSVEQSGRYGEGSFINFNGTAGIWRKNCINDAGGWTADTLTEDLDLSYRAQLKGWEFKYLEDVESPAELPITMSALKTQQFRWNKGGAETARKNLLSVLRAPIELKKKLHAFFHLTGSANFLCLLIVSLLNLPLIFIRQRHPQFNDFFQFTTVFVIGFFAISYFYWVSSKSAYGEGKKSYLFHYPLFLPFSLGMSLHNGLAVLEGFLGIKTPFLRTPKFNVVGSGRNFMKNSYLKEKKFSIVTPLEGILAIYFLVGLFFSVSITDYGLIVFHSMLVLGYAGVFYHSLRS